MQRAMFLGHLGLGDHIIQQGAVNRLAEKYERVLLFCKHHNVSSLRHMCGKNIDIVPVTDDNDVRRIHPLIEECDVFRVGIYDDSWNTFTNSGLTFDKFFYEQLNMDFAATYDLAIEDGEGWEEIMRLDPNEPFYFVHDDESRGLNIDENNIDNGGDIPIVRPVIRANTIFDYLPLIRRATEVHCIDSSFALMIDRASGIKATKYIHRYCREESDNPSYKNDWKVLQ
tara:strand:+ start:758 stop:1438 length:681 start_codon:yes stop_codon:yes gene_type:complete